MRFDKKNSTIKYSGIIKGDRFLRDVEPDFKKTLRNIYTPNRSHYLLFQQDYRPTPITPSLEPATYYHSTGSINPMKLIGILHHGILSKIAAEKNGLLIDANGLQCNGTDYISVSTLLGGCDSTNSGAFHFAIEREKLTTAIRKNPEQDMPLERQVHQIVPREAIKAIYLEKAGVLDIAHPQTTLGIGINDIERAQAQVHAYLNFMVTEFKHPIPTEDQLAIQEILNEMKKTWNNDDLSIREQEASCQQYERSIDIILKKHLKLCYQTLIPKQLITPYDIIRHYDQTIPVYDFEGNEILSLSEELTKWSTIDEMESDSRRDKPIFPILYENESPDLKDESKSTQVPHSSHQFTISQSLTINFFNAMNKTNEATFSESASNEEKTSTTRLGFSMIDDLD